MCQNDYNGGFTPMRYSRRPKFYNLNHIQAVKLTDFIPPMDEAGTDAIWVRVLNTDGSAHVPYWVKQWVKNHITQVITDYDLTDAVNELGFDEDRMDEQLPHTGGVAAVVDDDFEHPVFPGDYLVSLKNRYSGFTTFIMPEAVFDKMYSNDYFNNGNDDGEDDAGSAAGVTSDEISSNSNLDDGADSLEDTPVDVDVAPTREELSELDDKFDNDALRKVALTAPTKKAIADFVGYNPTTISDWIKKTHHDDVRRRFGLA